MLRRIPVVLLLIYAAGAHGAMLQVGPTRALKSPSMAAAIAKDGDVIEIDAEEYVGDVAVWRGNGLTLRGVGGMAHMVAAGQAAEGKAIWVIKGRDTTVERIEFSGAHVPDKNGAGIRQEGENLTVRRCYFHDNENGILGGAGDVLIEHSEFARNGHGDGQSHNLYIGERTRRLIFRYNYSHHARVGHNLKSRAAETRVLYSRLMDEYGGNSSYLIDLSDGGLGFLIGNLLQQGKNTDNHTLVSYGAEGRRHERNALYVVNNTFVNDRADGGVFVANRYKDITARLINNIFAGAGQTHAGNALLEGNVKTLEPGLRNRAEFDYRLTAGAGAIDRGVPLGEVDGVKLVPEYQYRHPLDFEFRPWRGRIDAGAYEYKP